MTRVKVAGVQSACGPDREKNVARAVELAGMAVESGAKIVCFEQLFSTFWFPREKREDFFSLAEDEGGPTLRTLAAVAAEKGVTLVCPLFERAGEGEYYNTAFILGPDGKILGRYRKVHVPGIPLWEEKFYFRSGNLGFPVFESQGLKFGVQLCWDNFFPEGARLLALGGADLVFCPNAAAFASSRRWETVISASAIVNGIYLFRVNRVGREEKQDFYGRSFFVNPEGEMLMPPSGMSNGVIMAEVDRTFIEETRREWNFLGDRRKEAYGD